MTKSAALRLVCWLVVGLLFSREPATADAAPSADPVVPPADVVYLLASAWLVHGADGSGPAEQVVLTGTARLAAATAAPGERPRSARVLELAGWSRVLRVPLRLADHAAVPGAPAVPVASSSRRREEPVSVAIGPSELVVEVADRTLVSDGAIAWPGSPVDPVALRDDGGRVSAWLRGGEVRAVAPGAIYRMPLRAEVSIARGGETERVELEGPVEILEYPETSGSVPRAEIVQLGLSGESALLGGPIVVTASLGSGTRRSVGHLGDASRFTLWAEIGWPGGAHSPAVPVALTGETWARQQVEQMEFGEGGSVPVFHTALALDGDWPAAAGAEPHGARPVSLILDAGRLAAPRPCCPRRRAPQRPTEGGR